MSGDYRSEPPVVCRWLVRLASLMVPLEERAAWRGSRDASLHGLWVLALRGELPGRDFAFLAWWCGDALADAFRTQCRGFDVRRWVRAPSFLLAGAATALVLMAASTHGFAVTRSLLHSLGRAASIAEQDRLVANLFPVAFALVVSIIAAVGRVSPGGHSWRYRSFLLLKTLLLVTIVPLLWIEGGAAFRKSIPNETVRILAGGLVLVVVFIATFEWAVLWSLADQRHRCPVCLRRLVMPVRIGTWASVFEPVTTEWICEAGHGSLCVCEVEAGEPDHWMELAAAAEYCHEQAEAE
ncbi:MAG: hypothetical protein P4L56_02275 [Candidatus Sulfopaludibacter sp.]|nr:hypothetical protein [Candidatus Sulfopaludibacter sp.]